MYTTIFLNIVKATTKHDRERELKLAATYRQLLWTVRLETTKSEKEFSDRLINSIYEKMIAKIT